MRDKSGDNIGGFKVEIKTNTGKFTNIIIARVHTLARIFAKL